MLTRIVTILMYSNLENSISYARNMWANLKHIWKNSLCYQNVLESFWKCVSILGSKFCLHNNYVSRGRGTGKHAFVSMFYTVLRTKAKLFLIIRNRR